MLYLTNPAPIVRLWTTFAQAYATAISGPAMLKTVAHERIPAT